MTSGSEAPHFSFSDILYVCVCSFIQLNKMTYRSQEMMLYQLMEILDKVEVHEHNKFMKTYLFYYFCVFYQIYPQ